MVGGHEQMADHHGHGIVTWYVLKRTLILFLLLSASNWDKWSIGNISWIRNHHVIRAILF